MRLENSCSRSVPTGETASSAPVLVENFCSGDISSMVSDSEIPTSQYQTRLGAPRASVSLPDFYSGSGLTRRMDRQNRKTDTTVIAKITASELRHRMHHAKRTYFSRYVRYSANPSPPSEPTSKMPGVSALSR